MRPHPPSYRPRRPPAGRRPPTPGGGWSAGLTPLEQLGLILLAIGFAVGGVVWAAAQLVARIGAGTWLPVQFGEMMPILGRLGQQPGEPAAAFGPEAAALLPGPIAFWGAVVALLILPIGVAGGVVRRRTRNAHDELEPARWATRADLKPLIVRRPTPGRITLGTAQGKLLAAEPGHSLLVMGPTQSGKTSSLAIPAIRDWHGPVVATSVKTDLLDDTLSHRLKHEDAETWVYDPTNSVPNLPSATWSPLAGCDTWPGALRTATWLVDAARDTHLKDADFWYANAAKLLAPLLHAAALAGRTIADVVAWVDLQETRDVAMILEHHGAGPALAALTASTKREERTRSSVYTTTETIVRAFADPDVAASATTSDIAPQRLLDGRPHTLYLCAPLHEQARLRPLFTALIQSVLHTAYTRAAEDRLDPPLLLVLDEAANIAPLPGLAQIASTASSLGIQLVTIWQDRAQIVTRYNTAAATVVNNHRAKVILSGIADPTTTTDTAQAIGDTEVIRHTTTLDAEGRTSTSAGGHLQPLAPAAGLRLLRPFEAVLLYGHMPPARLRLTPWFDRPPRTRRRSSRRRRTRRRRSSRITGEGPTQQSDPLHLRGFRRWMKIEAAHCGAHCRALLGNSSRHDR